MKPSTYAILGAGLVFFIVIVPVVEVSNVPRYVMVPIPGCVPGSPCGITKVRVIYQDCYETLTQYLLGFGPEFCYAHAAGA